MQKGFAAPLILFILLVIGVAVGVYLNQSAKIFNPSAFFQETGQTPVVIGMNYNHTSYDACNLTPEGSLSGLGAHPSPLDNTNIITVTPNTCLIQPDGTCSDTIIPPQNVTVQINPTNQTNLTIKVRDSAGNLTNLTAEGGATVGVPYDAPWIQGAGLTFELYSGTTKIGSVFAKGVNEYKTGWDNTGIIISYDKPGVRDLVKSQLLTMKNAGIQSIGLNILHINYAPHPRFDGVVPSTTHKLEEPYRTNLINYLKDVKAMNFERIMITMGPQWANSPAAVYKPDDPYNPINYDPALFEENWKFLQDIRGLVKEHGPTDSYFDILGEGAPIWDDHTPNRNGQLIEYNRRLWTNYVDAYGKDDAVISFTYLPTDQKLSGINTIQMLYDIFQSTGRGQPNWYSFSYYPKYGTYQESLDLLNAFDQKMNELGLPNTPFRVREGWYNNEANATAIRDFNNTHNRKVLEVLAWPLYYAPPYDPHCFVSPSYNMLPYISHLQQAMKSVAVSPTPAQQSPSPSPSISPSPAGKVGDLNNDGKVNIFDFNIFVQDYPMKNLRSDLNRNGTFDIFDFNLLVSNFGT